MKFIKKLFWPVFYLIIAVVFIIVVRALDSRSLPDLKPWHKLVIEDELLVSKDYQSIDSYLNDEDRYIRDIFAQVADSATGKFNRFNSESNSSPLFNDDNLNASFVIDPGKKHTKGVILLLHGLTDSPYHMRALGEVFKKEGFYVLALRLPGHGTVPSALLDVTWQQWEKATEWGTKRLLEIAHQRGDVPLYMGGFSTGGALILNYSLKAISDNTLKSPKQLFFFSPAIGVSKMGVLSAWHKTLSWMDYFEKFRWLDVLPEYDPAKYNSFSKNAGRQVYLLTIENKNLIDQVIEDSLQNRLPSMIAFQSLADATVIPKDLIEMYQKIGSSKDELFVFDVNRMYSDFMQKSVLNNDPRNIEFEQSDKPVLHMLINNLVYDSIHGPIACGVYEKINTDSLIDVYPNHHGYWPAEFFAMSHVAVPISPDNGAYGAFSIMGKLRVKGERNVLLVSSDDIMRIRYNPFFDLMSREISDFIKRDH